MSRDTKVMSRDMPPIFFLVSKLEVLRQWNHVSKHDTQCLDFYLKCFMSEDNRIVSRDLIPYVYFILAFVAFFKTSFLKKSYSLVSEPFS